MESSGRTESGAGGSKGKMGMLLVVGLWLLTVLEALAMGAVGAAKFGGEVWLQMFEGWGYPGVFTYVIGAAEVGGALLLLMPRTASYAAALLIVVMLGAGVTLATTSYDTGMGLRGPTIHLVVLCTLMWARWSKRWRPGG